MRTTPKGIQPRVAAHAGRATTVPTNNVPRLLNGDHLTVPEFERRYWRLPNDKRAELIEGIVVMTSPMSCVHGDAHSALSYLLSRYAMDTPGVSCASTVSLRLDGKNEYQPDLSFRIESGPLARTRVGEDGLIDGGPELVAEIAVSSASYDLHEKKTVYQRALVPEYLVWPITESEIHWFFFAP